MKKALILLTFFIVVTVLVIYWAIYTSFVVVKPLTDQIDKDLENYFSKTFQIPQNIPHPAKDLEFVKYQWEMETLQKEISGVELEYTPSFFSDEETITANLKMVENGDPSLFLKVLPAIITDSQSIKTAQEPERGNFQPNSQAGYQKLEVMVEPKNKQTINIKWEFSKDNLPQEIKNKYQKLAAYPKPLFKFLYKIPSFLISLAQG